MAAFVDRGERVSILPVRTEREEAIDAAYKTFVDCAGCGRPFRGLGIVCTRCRWKPRSRVTDYQRDPLDD